MYLPVTVKEIQAEYLIAQNNVPSTKTETKKLKC